MAKEEFSISRLFFAGVVTAAGAAMFWWLTGTLRKPSRNSDTSHDDLDRMLLVAEADQP